MSYKLCKNVMTDDKARAAFDLLAKQTFGLSFEAWYQAGYWTESNMPYTLFDGEKAVSNISVNQMEIEWDGKPRSYIQLGTVMTDEKYRNLGLSRRLMEEVLRDWSGRCEGMILFANQTVLSYYPKFGFQRQIQYQYSREIAGCAGYAEKLNMKDPVHLELLKHYYKKKNPFSRFQTVHGYELLMFYCCSFQEECVYYIKEQDAVVIAEQEKGNLICYDIFCDAGKDIIQILAPLLEGANGHAVFAFTPKDTENCGVKMLDDGEDALFVLSGKENLFLQNQIMFPQISHT